jgi:hypothetical protein
MIYWDYLGSLMRHQLKVDWPLPHIWATVYGLETLQTVVEEVVRLQGHPERRASADRVTVNSRPSQLPPSIGQIPGDEHKKPRIRTGFLCKSQGGKWYWLLTRPHYKTVVDWNASYINVLLNEGIPPHTGMIGALNKHILAKTEDHGEGGVFSSLAKNTLIEMADYPTELKNVERELWPDDEFIGEFLLGFVKVDQGALNYDLWRPNANSVEDKEIAVVFVYCTGLEPFAPRQVLDAYLSITEIKQFFWRFLKEYGPALNDATDALIRSAVASIMARNMSHNIGSHVSARTTMDSIQRRLSELYSSVASGPKGRA